MGYKRIGTLSKTRDRFVLCRVGRLGLPQCKADTQHDGWKGSPLLWLLRKAYPAFKNAVLFHSLLETITGYVFDSNSWRSSNDLSFELFMACVAYKVNLSPIVSFLDKIDLLFVICSLFVHFHFFAWLKKAEWEIEFTLRYLNRTNEYFCSCESLKLELNIWILNNMIESDKAVYSCTRIKNVGLPA